MALRKVQGGAIANNAITSDKIAAGAVSASDIASSAISDKLGYIPANETTVNTQINSALVDPVFTGDSITIPAGTTAERPASPTAGMVRYNTDTGLVEQYNSAGWQGIDAPPVITNFSGIINSNSNSTLTINGSNFKAGCVVYIEGNGVNNTSRTLTTTFVSSSQLMAETNASSANYVGGESFNIKVSNPSGLTSTLSPAGTIDRDPIWSTGAGTLATINDAYGSYSPIATVSASDPDGTAIVYSITSGALPTNVTLNTSNGQISGDPNNVSGSTTYTFEITATSNTQAVPRTFNIIVNPTADGSSSTRAAASGKAIQNLGLATGYYWIAPSGQSAKYCYVDNTNYGGGWVLVQSVGSQTNYHWAQTTDYNLYNNGTTMMIPFSGTGYDVTSGRRYSDAFIKAIGINGDGLLRYEIARNGASPTNNNAKSLTTDYRYAAFVRYDNGFTWFNSSNNGGDSDRVSKAVDISHEYPFNWETGGSGHYILYSSSYKVLDMHSDPSSISTSGYSAFRILFGYSGASGNGIYGGSNSFVGDGDNNPGYQWVR